MPRPASRLREFEPRWRLYLPLLAIVVVVALWGRNALAERVHYPRRMILDAIRQVESSGRANPPDGDGGKAIGPFQIHRIYWHDAIDYDPDLGGNYEQCRDLGYATRIVHAYMQRWVPSAWRTGNAEMIARVHNGGPEGPKKNATLGYWHRVKAELDR